jgi:hypothetical protein
MPTENKYDRILAYLKGLLSNRQRHNLERDMMQDVFEEEAFEGLSHLSGTDLENDMKLLQNRLDARIIPARKNRLPFYFRLAAAVALLIGVGSIIYFVFRTPNADLLTEEHKLEKPAVRSAPSPNLIQTESDNEKSEKPLQLKRTDITKKIMQEPTEDQSESKEEFITQAAAAPEKKESEELAVSGVTESAAPGVQMRIRGITAKPQIVYSGTVVDNSGEILPGVVVFEKGTTNSTITDKNGNFNLPLQDTNSLLALNYIGYKTVELEAAEKPKDKIVMEEDVTALNEVVVTGYATQKRSSVTGAIATVKVDEEAGQSQTDQPVLTKPIPPGGSLKAYKKWVNDRLDYTAYKDYPGKHKITVEITVHANGTISNILVNKNAPDLIAADMKKVISQSSLWTAALKDDNPVDADVEIHFVITVE